MGQAGLELRLETIFGQAIGETMNRRIPLLVDFALRVDQLFRRICLSDV